MTGINKESNNETGGGGGVYKKTIYTDYKKIIHRKGFYKLML